MYANQAKLTVLSSGHCTKGSDRFNQQSIQSVLMMRLTILKHFYIVKHVSVTN